MIRQKNLRLEIDRYVKVNYLRLLCKRQVISVLKLPIKARLLGVFLVILKADLSIQQGVLHLSLHGVIQERCILSLAF